MLCALQCLAVRNRFTRCASNFACIVHIDTRWCTRFFNVLGPFLDTEIDYLLDGLYVYLSVYVFDRMLGWPQKDDSIKIILVWLLETVKKKYRFINFTLYVCLIVCSLQHSTSYIGGWKCNIYVYIGEYLSCNIDVYSGGLTESISRAKGTLYS